MMRRTTITIVLLAALSSCTSSSPGTNPTGSVSTRPRVSKSASPSGTPATNPTPISLAPGIYHYDADATTHDPTPAKGAQADTRTTLNPTLTAYPVEQSGNGQTQRWVRASPSSADAKGHPFEYKYLFLGARMYWLTFKNQKTKPKETVLPCDFNRPIKYWSSATSGRWSASGSCEWYTYAFNNTIVGKETRQVGGASVQTVHFHRLVSIKSQDGSIQHQTLDQWFLSGQALLVSETAKIESADGTTSIKRTQIRSLTPDPLGA